jgi:hypothetical protein
MIHNLATYLDLTFSRPCTITIHQRVVYISAHQHLTLTSPPFASTFSIKQLQHENGHIQRFIFLWHNRLISIQPSCHHSSQDWTLRPEFNHRNSPSPSPYETRSLPLPPNILTHHDEVSICTPHRLRRFALPYPVGSSQNPGSNGNAWHTEQVPGFVHCGVIILTGFGTPDIYSAREGIVSCLRSWWFGTWLFSSLVR